MPKSIEHTWRKRDAVRGAALFGLLQLVCTVFIAWLCFIPGLPKWAVALFAALAVFCAVPVVLFPAVLKQRFREIEGGEEDAAAQY